MGTETDIGWVAAAAGAAVPGWLSNAERNWLGLLEDAADPEAVDKGALSHTAQPRPRELFFQ